MLLITDAYRDLQRQMHAGKESYANMSATGQRAEMVRMASKWGRKRILDYGCGKQKMAEALGPAYKVTGYDPAVEGIDQPPEPHPVVVCTDVLEHVEPDCIDAVLRDIRRVTQERAVLMIATAPANRTLPDGRNCHLIVEDRDWWEQKIKIAGFHISGGGDGVGPDGKVVGCWLEVHPC